MLAKSKLVSKLGSKLSSEPKNDKKLNHWAEYRRPLPPSVRARECGLGPVAIRPIPAAVRRPAVRYS